MGGKIDPYVIVKLGTQQQRTDTHNEGGNKPSWNNVLLFNKTSVDNSDLIFECWDNDRMRRDNLLGKGTCSLAALALLGKSSQSIELRADSGKIAGSLEVEIELEGTRTSGSYVRGTTIPTTHTEYKPKFDFSKPVEHTSTVIHTSTSNTGYVPKYEPATHTSGLADHHATKIENYVPSYQDSTQRASTHQEPYVPKYQPPAHKTADFKHTESTWVEKHEDLSREEPKIEKVETKTEPETHGAGDSKLGFISKGFQWIKEKTVGPSEHKFGRKYTDDVNYVVEQSVRNRGRMGSHLSIHDEDEYHTQEDRVALLSTELTRLQFQLEEQREECEQWRSKISQREADLERITRGSQAAFSEIHVRDCQDEIERERRELAEEQHKLRMEHQHLSSASYEASAHEVERVNGEITEIRH